MAENDILGNLLQEEQVIDNSFSDLFSYFDSRYGGDTERTNYVNVLKSMTKEKDVSGLVSTYNKVLHKLLIFAYGTEENISTSWYNFGLLLCEYRIWNDLKAYLNEQIKRVFDTIPYSDKLSLECLTNLRESRNEDNIKEYILSKSSEEVITTFKQITVCRQIVHDAQKHVSLHHEGTNDYREYKPKYIDNIKFLIKNGYHKGYDDTYFELKANVMYFPDTESILLFVLLLIILVPIVLLLTKYGLLAIFFIICLLAIIKLIR